MYLLSLVGAPASPRGDLPLAFAKIGFSEHPEHTRIIRQEYTTNTQTRRLLQQNGLQALARQGPDFQGNRDSAGTDTLHSRVSIINGPEAIQGSSVGFPHKRGADPEEILVQRQRAHQSAVDGQV
jgi:hypothetical protein